MREGGGEKDAVAASPAAKKKGKRRVGQETTGCNLIKGET